MTAELAVLHGLSSPALIWVGEGERLDLTGVVVANWIHKSRGLLMETGVGPEMPLMVPAARAEAGTRLHWRELVTVLAALACGADVEFLPAGATPVSEVDEACVYLDVELLTGHPDWLDAAEVLAFAAPALALQTDTPPDVVDASSAVRTQPDICPFPWTATGALLTGGERLPASDLLGGPPGAPGPVALSCAPRDAAGWQALLSGLLHHPPVVLGTSQAAVVDATAGRSGGHGRLGTWTK